MTESFIQSPDHLCCQVVNSVQSWIIQLKLILCVSVIVFCFYFSQDFLNVSWNFKFFVFWKECFKIFIFIYFPQDLHYLFFFCHDLHSFLFRKIELLIIIHLLRILAQFSCNPLSFITIHPGFWWIADSLFNWNHFILTFFTKVSFILRLLSLLFLVFRIFFLLFISQFEFFNLLTCQLLFYLRSLFVCFPAHISFS